MKQLGDDMSIKTTIVFTDDRLDGVEIRCYGSSTFEIYRGGKLDDCYTHYESETSSKVSGMFAKRSAQEHFDQLITELEEMPSVYRGG